MIDFSCCTEAKIMGIRISKDSKILSIEIQCTDNHSVEIEAEDIDRFVANEFREQNIIDRVTLWGVGSHQDEFESTLSRLFTAPNEGVDSKILPLIDTEIKGIEEGKKNLVEIEPVYGASIIILAKNVRLIDL